MEAEAAAKRARESGEDAAAGAGAGAEAAAAGAGEQAGISAVIPGWFSEISPMWPGASLVFRPLLRIVMLPCSVLFC
jgi:spermidine synthase